MKTNRLRDKIAQGINDLFYIWKQEFKTTFRDQGVLILQFHLQQRGGARGARRGSGLLALVA